MMQNSGVYCDNENPVHDMSSSFRCDVETAGHLQINSSWGRLMAAKVLLAPLWGRLIWSRTCSHLSLHQGADYRAGVKVAQVVVGLPCTHKHDRLTCDVRHRDGSTDLRGGQERSGRINRQIPYVGCGGGEKPLRYLVVNRVKLCENDPVNKAGPVWHGVVCKSLVELHLRTRNMFSIFSSSFSTNKLPLQSR